MWQTQDVGIWFRTCFRMYLGAIILIYLRETKYEVEPFLDAYQTEDAQWLCVWETVWLFWKHTNTVPCCDGDLPGFSLGNLSQT